MRTRTAAVFLTLALAGRSVSGAPPARVTDPALASLGVSVDVERRATVKDLEELDRVTSRLGRAQSALSTAMASFTRLVREGGADRTDVETAIEAVADASARVRAEEERRRDLVNRLGERATRVAALREEIARRHDAGRGGVRDPISGRWEVVINPGSQKGTFRLALDSALVSGDYTLDGGFHGSLRGQYVGDRLTLQRIDAERGVDATFYGRVNAAQKRVVGTWESTAIAPATGPTAGTWGGALLPERDEDEENTP